MKIKRLIIRNIASIEQGEIDFEKGLINRETGNPASLFLITGDTGSGKSVILDCISMALYGTTPRVKSVNGVKNNVYHNNNGEEISVNDITQYTRIGISWRDDCFSELSFTGNDGVDYISKFTLGRTSHNNYRKPEWTLKVGDDEIIENRKEEIKEQIQRAVGLSFEQFSRMAMLAQGQFATFLTGKKEERERILEQLTATDIFSRYGEAISNIFKNSKHEFDTSRKIYEEFSKKILDDTIREKLITEQSEKNKEATKLQTETDNLRRRINCTDAILKTDKDIAALKEEAAKLKTLEDTSEFRKRKAILSLWDSTSAQRELLSDKIKAAQSLTNDRKTLQEKKYEFLLLSKDLNARKTAAEEKTRLLEKQRLWIESQQPLKKLFNDSSEVISDINRFVSIVKEVKKKENEVETAKANIDELKKNISSKNECYKLQNEKCDECKAQITKKTSDRDTLNPTALRNENELLTKRQIALTDLSVRMDSLEAEKQDIEKAEKKYEEISILFSSLKSDAEKASEECACLEKEKNASDSRYRTMLLSVDKKFEAIRRQLVEEHANNCPLCGQSIEGFLTAWKSKEYFSDILSPLEEEKNKCLEAYNAAKKKADDAKEKMDTTSGILKAKEDDLNKRKSKISKNQKEIEDILKSLKIVSDDTLKTFLSDELSQLKGKIEVISEKLKQAENLQKEINTLISNKDSLDKGLKEIDKQLQETLKSVAQKETATKMALDRIEELKKEKESLQEKISFALKDYVNQWIESPEEIATKLKEDADNFSTKVEIFSKEEPAHIVLLKTIESINTVRDNLLKLIGTTEPLEKQSKFSDLKNLNQDEILERWHSFQIEVSTTYGKIIENETKLSELEKSLQEYYQASGSSETALKQLLDAADEISQMRSLQESHRENLHKNATLLEEANKSKHENLKILNLNNETELDDIEKLKSDLNSLVGKHSEFTKRLGAIKERLEADEKTRLESETQKEELEKKSARMHKWEIMNKYFGGTRFRTLVQSYILRPLLNNANIYLRQITDHYLLTCSDENEQLSILVRDRYHNNEPRSVTVLSGGERFMVSLALSLALSAMNRPDMNVDILFIDEGFGTLDAKSLDLVMNTLRRLPEINGQTGRRVGVISHREELTEQIDCQIKLRSCGEGRSRIEIS